MKTDIHPDYDVVSISCSCGNVIETRSTASEKMSVELCSECHPFYTGKQKLVDTGGRIERFERRFGRRKAVQADESSDEATDEAPAAEAPAAEAPAEEAPAAEAPADEAPTAEAPADAATDEA